MQAAIRARGTALAALLAAMAMSACGTDAENAPTSGEPVTEQDDNSTKTSAIDPETGLQFTVYSSNYADDPDVIYSSSDSSSSVSVELTEDASDATREAVLGKQVAVKCTVPEQEVRYFPQEWDQEDDQVGSALLPADDATNVAAEATSCSLALADPDDPEVFDEDPYSEVDLG